MSNIKCWGERFSDFSTLSKYISKALWGRGSGMSLELLGGEVQ